jgi:plastocyanin
MWPLLAALGMVGGLVVLGPPAAAPAAEGAQVFMVDNEPDLTNWHFDPAEITVPAGTTVAWVNKGKEEHTVTADDKSFDSGMKRPGASWQRAFPKPGRYTYYCAPHPWMKGAVRVVGTATAAGRTASEAGAPPATATTAASSPPTTTATIPATFAPPSGGQGAATPPAPSVTATSAPAADTAPPAQTSEDEAAAGPGRGGDDSGDGLAGTLALVLIPTAAGLALGAKLRQRSSSAEA